VIGAGREVFDLLEAGGAEKLANLLNLP